MSSPWRCFIAVPIGESLREELATMVAAIRDDSAAAELRWTDPATWHLTIAFLGATPSDDVDRVAAMMRRATGTMETFTVRTGGLGGFPSAAQTRVVWYGVDDHDGALRHLAELTHKFLGIERPRRFRAHLTLARSRQRFGGPNLSDWLPLVDAPATGVRVDRLVLFRSHLGRGPARYESLASAQVLPPAAHA